MQNTVNTSVPSATNAAEIAKAMPVKSTKQASVKLDAIKAKVKVTTGKVNANAAEKSNSSRNSDEKALLVDLTPKLSVERAIEEDITLVAQPRAQYVAAFKRGVEKTARATLETCRVVYEANRMLDSYQFQNFCKDIGYRDNSSSIRKFIAIGKVYPRFIQYADQLPSAWTAIYQITQIPADEFENYLKHGKRLDELKGKRLQALMGLTKPLDNLVEPLNFDSASGGFVFAKLVAVRQFDDVDWRAIEKAMGELAARLPVKFVVPSALTKLVEQRRLRRYQSAKKHYEHQEFKPDTWDMGDEANAVLPRKEPEVVEV
jgi:hypothetical protein